MNRKHRRKQCLIVILIPNRINTSNYNDKTINLSNEQVFGTTNKEMENANKMIELNYEKAVKDNKYMKQVRKKTNGRSDNKI